MTSVLSSDVLTPIGTTLPADWKLLPLGDLCSKIGSGATPRGGAAAYREDGTAFIRSQNVFDHKFSNAGLAFIDADSAGKLANVEVRPRDVLLNITGDGDTIARCCIVPAEILPARVNQHVLILRADSGLVPEFLQRYLSHPSMREFMLNHNSGGSRRALTKKLVEGFKVAFPPIDEQRAIAEVLDALDDKIAANTKLAETARSLGRALFQNAVSGPESVSLRLSAVAKNLPGKYLAKDDYVSDGPYFVYGSNSIMGRHSEALCQGGFSVLAKIGSYCGNLRWSQRPAWVNNNAAAIVPLPGMAPSILRHALERIEMAPHRAGTGQPYIRMESLFSSEIVVPDSDASRAISPTLECLSESEARLGEENQTLAATRDALLPQLMSGKLRIKDAETVLEEAGV